MTDALPKSHSPVRVASILLAFVILTMSFGDDLEYSSQHRKNPDIFMDVLRGTALAPAQYRIGVLEVADFFARHSRLPLRHWIALIETAAAFLAVFILFHLLRRSSAWRQATEGGRWFAALAFVFLVHYYFSWVTYFQRPETLPTAALVALVFLLISVPLPLPRLPAALCASAGIILLAVMQGFVRSDVALALNAGIILLCLTRSAPGLALARVPQIVTSVVAGGLALGVQYYLMHVRYPHANYGGTPPIQLLLNFESPNEWTAFLLFILPFAWTVVTFFRERVALEPAPTAILYAAFFYLAFWFTFGRMEEVRIFLPVALAVVPATVVFGLQRFFPRRHEESAVRGAA